MLVSMQDGGIAYNQSFSFRLRESMDADVLDKALKALVDRHESLRTAFRMGPKGIEQLIAPSAADCNFKLEVATGPEADAEPSAVAAEHERHALEPFDLAKAPLMTATLFQVWQLSHTHAKRDTRLACPTAFTLLTVQILHCLARCWYPQVEQAICCFSSSESQKASPGCRVLQLLFVSCNFPWCMII